MMLSLFAKFGSFGELALAPKREALPDDRDWMLSRKNAIESGRLAPNLQQDLERYGFVLGRRRS